MAALEEPLIEVGGGETEAAPATRFAEHKSNYGRIVLSGVGFLADSYDLWVINIVTEMMQMVKYQEEQTAYNVGVVKTSMLVGCIMGQLLFGCLGDVLGRKPSFVITCALTIAGCIGSACVVDTPEYGVYTQLAVWRFFLGLGVGGEYPLAGTIASESSSRASRGRDLALLFSMQGFGRLLCNVVLIVLLQRNPSDYETNWRLAVAFGALPSIVAFYFRVTMEETEPFRASGQQGPTVMETISANWMLLLGTAGAWFILDVSFYGNSLFSGDVTQAMGVAKTPLDEAWQNMYLNLIALPGYILAVLFMDTVGRVRLQWMGFVGVAAIFAVLAMCSRQLEAFGVSYLVIYGLTFLLTDFGPNTTTYVIAATVFPTSARSTCAGISAAVGKAGAVLGGMFFKPIEAQYGIRAVFIACTLVCVLGGAWTIALVDDRESASLDDGYGGSVDGVPVEDYQDEGAPARLRTS